MLERTQATINTLHRLERHRGHFYNWYETRTLRPLIPLYVSSVDSGNLAGHLLTLACGLRELAEEKILDPQVFAGLRDTLALVQGLAGENALLSQLDAELAQTPSDLRAAATLLQRAVEQSAKISNALANRDGDLKAWAQTLQRSCVEHLDELNFHAPWLKDENLTSRIAQLHAAPSLREIATFDQLDGQFPAESEILREASKRARERVRALETLARQCDELAEMDFSFLFDKARNSVRHRFQRHRRPARSEFLRSARVGSAALQLSRHRGGAGATRPLVRAWPVTGRSRWRTDPGFVERIDV